MMECTRCGEELNEEEASDPRKDVDCDDGVICDDCHHEHYEFECYQCSESDSNDEMGKVLAISEECGGLEPGLYEITGRPYFISDYFNMWWLKEKMRKIADIPANANFFYGDCYPSGHLCSECQVKAQSATPA